MTHKVRIPYVLVVRKVTWRPAGEPMPVEATPQLTVANGVSLPIEEMNLHIDPATYDALVEQGKREYYAEKAAEAKAARAAEEAKWEPMPIPLGASRPLAALYGNMRRRKQPAASEPASQADAVADPWAARSETGRSLGRVERDGRSGGPTVASTASAADPASGEDASPSSSQGLNPPDDGSETGLRSSLSGAPKTSGRASQPLTNDPQNPISAAKTESDVASKPPTSHELAVALTNVADETPTTSANANLPKTPFLDDDGHPMLNYQGHSIMRSADRLDPHEMIAEGETLRQEATDPPSPVSPEATIAAPAEPLAATVDAYASLRNFRFAGPWDAQRLDASSGDPALVDYANELIGIYAKAAGIPLEGSFGVLEVANIHNKYKKNARILADHAPGYPYLSNRDAEDIRIGYNSVTDDGRLRYKGPKSAKADD